MKIRRAILFLLTFVCGILIYTDASAQQKFLQNAPPAGVYANNISLMDAPTYFNNKKLHVAGAKFANLYSSGLGFMCKAEQKLEVATKVPLRLRLGSLQHTDYLEQKPNCANAKK